MSSTARGFERQHSTHVANYGGLARIYMEGAYLFRGGFAPAQRISVSVSRGRMVIRPSDAGDRRVATRRRGGAVTPVIDLKTDRIREAFGPSERLRVIVREREIVITRERTDEARHSRCHNGRVGSMCTGAAFMDEAARLAGYEAAWGIEIHEPYARIAEANHPEMRMFNMSAAEVRLEDVDPVELFVVGLPCDPFSAKRRSAGGVKIEKGLAPEAHPLGDMVFWALRLIDHLTPAAVVVEEVPGFVGSGAYWILRGALERLGYEVDVRVIQASDYGAATYRKRAVLVATESAYEWPAQSPFAGTAAEILNPVDHPENEWFTMDSPTGASLRRQWAKHEARGSRFRGPVIRYDSDVVGTIGKLYGRQADSPLVCHPTEPDMVRWLTLSEVRRLHQVPDSYDLGESRSVAMEVLGQGVVVGVFRRIFEALRQASVATVSAVLVQGELAFA